MINNLDKIAEMYFEKGEYPRFIAYSLKTLIVIKCLHNDQVDPIRTANSLFNIGMAFMMKGQIDLSLSYHVKALHRRNKIFPDGDISICSSLSHTGNLYHLKKEHILALQYYENALIMYQKLFPDTYQINYNVGEIFFNMSNIYKITDNLNLAQQYAEKALDIFHNTTIPQNPSRIAAQENIDKIKELIK
jgi:tetratricopeptide (TPR) repeat protein